jgi:glucose-6-phosphate 1-dehydrogenase
VQLGTWLYKKIFPALQAMAKHGNLNVPVIGVARSATDLAALKARARESVEKHGGLDPAAFDKLVGLLRYVRGDNSDPATYKALRRELGDARHPAHYLAIPPTAFATVVEQLISAGCTDDARVILEKPFGTIRARLALQRFASTDQAAALVTFVASPHSSATNGAALHRLRFGACGVC